METIVNPITKSETLSFFAKSFAPSINHSDPKYKPNDPTTKKNKLDNISISRLC